MRIKNYLGYLASALCLASVSTIANAQDVDDEVRDTEEIIVTGTRLKNAAPTSPVVTITREDMDLQGLVTASDVVRSLPQNYSSVNKGSTTAFAAQGTPPQAIGTTSADLRGLGANGTLVLVNGRRLAGNAVYDSGQINLDTIPSAAIERVEVVLDGASAIYGADAVAGVINFILKEDYSGATTRVRYDSSANDADALVLSQTFGHNWDSGNVLLALEYRDTDGANAFKAGYTTRDLTSQGGRDHRDSFGSRPHPTANIIGFGALPDTFDGTENWDVTDLIPTSQLPPYDAATATKTTATASENTAFTLTARQDLGESVSVFAEAMYSKDENRSVGGDFTAIFIPVPATNPFNQLGADVFVSMLAEGLPVGTMSDVERVNVAAGADFDLPFKDWSLSLVGNYGSEESEFNQFNVPFDELFAFAATGNVFGNNLTNELAPLVRPFDSAFVPPERSTHGLEISANGSLFSIAGGDVSMAIGAQLREERSELDEIFLGSVGRLSVDQKLENQAYFFEFSVPLVSSDNAKTGVQGLLLSIAGRQEDYEMNGPFDGIGQPETTKKFSEFTPKLGIRWDVTDGFVIRSSWGQAFRAPNLDDLNSGLEYFPFFTSTYVDGNGDTQVVFFGRGGNPDLKAETSTSFTAGFEWAPASIDGLTISANYTDIDWDDRIDVITNGDSRLAGNNPEDFGLILFDVAVADGGDGDPTTPDAWPNRPINLANRRAEFLDFVIAYNFETGFGAIETDVTATHTLDVTEQLFSFSTPERREGTHFGPDDWVMRAHAGWNKSDYGAHLFANYSSSYEHTDPLTPQDKVDNYLTFDLTGFYEMDNGFKIRGGVHNLTDEKFPFFDNLAANYDARRVDARGRVIYLEISKEFVF